MGLARCFVSGYDVCSEVDWLNTDRGVRDAYPELASANPPLTAVSEDGHSLLLPQQNDLLRLHNISGFQSDKIYARSIVLAC